MTPRGVVITVKGSLNPTIFNLVKGHLSLETIWVWLFFDDIHLMISRCGSRLARCVGLGWETVPRREA